MNAHYLGTVQLEGTLTAFFITRNASTEVPTDADSLPTYTLFGPDGALSNNTGTATDEGVGLNKLTHSILAADGYAQGKTYFVDVRYAVASTNQAQLLSFTVI